jgi:hypothetical protein
MININNHFYFSIINTNSTPITTNTNTNTNSMIIVNPNSEHYLNHSNEKHKAISNIINKNSNKKNSIKEIKNKTSKRQKKINRIIKDMKNHNNLNNSNKIIKLDILNSKKNIITNTNSNYYKKKKIILNKNSNIEKERTSSLIQRQKNSKTTSEATNLNNFHDFVNYKLKSKNLFSSNNKSAIGHNIKKLKKNSLGGSRNYSKGLNKHFNNSFNESLIDKKYLNTIVNTDNNISKNNNSIILRTNEREREELDISNDYMIINKKTDAKENKGNKKVIKNFELSGHKYIYNRNHYNTINSENTNYKAKINNKSNNSTGKRKIYNRKHEKGFNSNKFVV